MIKTIIYIPDPVYPPRKVPKASILYFYLKGRANLIGGFTFSATGNTTHEAIAFLVSGFTLGATAILTVSPFVETWENGSGRWMLEGTYLSTTQAWSPTHSLTGASGPNYATSYAADGNNGNLDISAYVYVSSGGSAYVSVYFRADLFPLSTAQNYYCVSLEANGHVFIILCQAGLQNSLAAVYNSSITNKWLLLEVVAIGNTFNVSLQDTTTGLYLNADVPSQTFQAQQTYCLSITDSTISGSGYFGVNTLNTGGYLDNFSIDWEFATASLTSSSAFSATGNTTHEANSNLISASTIFTTVTAVHYAQASMIGYCSFGTTGFIINFAGAILSSSSSIFAVGKKNTIQSEIALLMADDNIIKDIYAASSAAAQIMQPLITPPTPRPGYGTTYQPTWCNVGGTCDAVVCAVTQKQLGVYLPPQNRNPVAWNSSISQLT